MARPHWGAINENLGQALATKHPQAPSEPLKLSTSLSSDKSEYPPIPCMLAHLHRSACTHTHSLTHTTHTRGVASTRELPLVVEKEKEKEKEKVAVGSVGGTLAKLSSAVSLDGNLAGSPKALRRMCRTCIAVVHRWSTDSFHS